MDDAGERLKFEGKLILNWRNGEMRVVRKRANYDNPSEIAIPFKINVNMPEFKPPSMEADVVVPEKKVRDAVLQGGRGRMSGEIRLEQDGEPVWKQC